MSTPSISDALVEGEVVIDELAEVREAGRDPALREIVGGHRLRDLQPGGLADLHAGALGPQSREAERSGRLRGLDLDRDRRLVSAPSCFAEQSFADHEVGL